MECTLAHKSSLELWSHLAEAGFAPTRYDRAFKSKGASVNVAAKDADFWLKRGGFFSEPLHIAVGSPSERCRTLRCVSHISRQLGNKGTLWGVAPKLATVSPAMCLAQFAGELPVEQLTELACALSGNYCFAAKPKGVVTSALPLVSLRDMYAFLHAHQQIRGASKALRAIDLAIDHLGSPYETILYLLLCLPRKLGGYGFPKPVANQSIAPKSRDAHLVAQREFYPDLLWPDRRFIIEYDSLEHHSAPEKAEHDARRRNDLESIGYRVMVANRSIISSAALFSQFADNVRRELGVRSRSETTHYLNSRMQLRKLLLTPNSLAELWR